MRRKLLRSLAALLCAALFSSTAMAAGQEFIEISFVEIETDGDYFVADTLNSVEARYGSGSFDCYELISRYYETLYGVSVIFRNGSLVVKDSTDCWFEKTDMPQTGDVLFGAAASRGRPTDHWTLCKYAGDNSVTLIEQNWSWNGQAAVNRVTAWPSEIYTAFTLVNADGRVLPTLQTADTVSDWAKSYIEQAREYGLLDTVVDGYRTPITRGEFATLLVKAAETNGVQAPTQNVCQASAELGLMGGDENLDFHENKTITREQAAVSCVRLLELIGEAPEADKRVLRQYADADEISVWASEAATIMTEIGLMGGTGSGFAPSDTLTTEQAIVLIMRICGNPNPANVQSAVKVAASQPEEQQTDESPVSAGELVSTGSAVGMMIGLSYVN